MFFKCLHIKIIYAVNSKQIMPLLMMKDIPISEVSDAEYVVSNNLKDYYNFEKIIENYNIYHDKDICNRSNQSRFFFFFENCLKYDDEL